MRLRVPGSSIRPDSPEMACPARRGHSLCQFTPVTCDPLPKLPLSSFRPSLFFRPSLALPSPFPPYPTELLRGLNFPRGAIDIDAPPGGEWGKMGGTRECRWCAADV
ncbi:unnamed protein product [Closterium sp. NIES-65]|nr:unnamed protein product [Closterium sp. NIES-65]